MSDKKRKQYSRAERPTHAEVPARVRVHGRLSMRKFWDLVDPGLRSRDQGLSDVTDPKFPEKS